MREKERRRGGEGIIFLFLCLLFVVIPNVYGNLYSLFIESS